MKLRAMNFILWGLLLLCACTLPGTPTQKPATPPLPVGDQPVYSGPIEILIDTGWQGVGSNPPRQIKLTPQWLHNFYIQAQGAVPVFEETLTLQNGSLALERTFSALDTSKRYVLSIHPETATVVLSQCVLNGVALVAEQEEVAIQTEMQRNKLLLQAQNTLNLEMTGETGAQVTIRIFETDLAGTIFRRSQQYTPVSTVSVPPWQALDPSEGDRDFAGHSLSSLQFNQEPVLHFETGLLTVEFMDPNVDLPFFQNLYGMTLDSSLEIDDQTFYYLKPNLQMAPLAQAQVILQAYNQQYQDNIQHLRLSSLAALQTLLIEMDMLTTHRNRIKRVSMNGINPHLPIAQSQILPLDTSDDIQGDDPYMGVGKSPRDTSLGFGTNAQRVGRTWFLHDTRTLEAWSYSLGTGVKVAWIDVGYGPGLKVPVSGATIHPELEDRRIDFANNRNMAFPNAGSPQTYPANLHLLYPKQIGHDTHGIESLQAGFAEKNNGRGSAGTAPNTSLVLYNAGTVKEVSVAVKAALDSGSQVIGLNQSWGNGRNIAEYPDLLAAITKALQQNVPVIVPANNFGKTIVKGHSRSYQVDPAGHYEAPALNNLIVAGGVGLNFESSLGPVREVLQEGLTNNAPEYGTVARDTQVFGLPDNTKAGLIGWFYPEASQNPIEVSKNCLDYTGKAVWDWGCFGYGTGFDHLNKSRLVWAPAERIIHEDVKQQTKLTSGTSMAAPFVTGVVALMKSRNPDITPAQILAILRSNSFLTVRANPEMKRLGLTDNDSKMIDVASAVIRAIDPNQGGSSGLNTAFQEKYRAKQWIGVVEGNKSLKTPTGSLQLMQSISNLPWNRLTEGKAVVITGWKGNGFIRQGRNLLAENTIEILDYEEITDKFPVITDVQAFQQGTKVGKPNQPAIYPGRDFVIQIKGKYFLHQNTGRLKMRMIGQIGSPMNLELQPTQDNTKSFIDESGMMAQFFVQANQHDASGAYFQGNTSYNLRLSNALNKDSNVYVPEGTYGLAFSGSPTVLDISAQEPPLPERGFRTLSVAPELPPVGLLPQGNYAYDQVGNRWMRPGFRIQVDANEFAGIRFTQPIRDLEVKIGPVLVPITSILNDLAVIGIPDNLPAGVHDVVIKASGQTLTLEQAVEKVSQAIPPTPEPTAPPSGNPGEYESVRVFNIEGNDEGRVYLNDQLILTAHAGEDNYASLGTYGSYPLHKDQRNEFRFELVNNGGGYTYGFELRAQYNGTAAYRDIQGSPGLQNKVWPDGSEDQRQGVVYNERMITNSKFSPVGTGPFWMKVFNLNPDESLTIQTYNDTNDIQWPDGVFRVGPPINSQEISKQLPIQPFDPFSSCGLYDPNFECWNPRYIGFSFENPTGPYNIGIEVYKGINLVYRNIQGQRGVWGAEENQEGSSNPYIQDYVAHQYRHYPAGY